MSKVGRESKTSNLAVMRCMHGVDKLGVNLGGRSKWICPKTHGQENTSRNKKKKQTNKQTNKTKQNKEKKNTKQKQRVHFNILADFPQTEFSFKWRVHFFFFSGLCIELHASENLQGIN